MSSNRMTGFPIRFTGEELEVLSRVLTALVDAPEDVVAWEIIDALSADDFATLSLAWRKVEFTDRIRRLKPKGGQR
jgi:hypothetical protein